MTVETISPYRAKEIMEQGGILVDIREGNEHARERIPGAVHFPMSKLYGTSGALKTGCTVVFHCKSGARTRIHAARLRAAAPGCQVLVVEGGIDAWRRAGLPVDSGRRQRIESQREVRQTASNITSGWARWLSRFRRGEGHRP